MGKKRPSKKRPSKKRPTGHHRRCRSNGGTDDTPKNNVSVVTDVQHEAFHTLFGNAEAERIAEILNETWIDPSWELIARRRNGNQKE
jgi:hypothetical protein